MSAFTQKNTQPAPVIYSGLNVGTSQFDLPVPIFWGQRRLTTNAIWFNGFTKTPVSGKGKGGGAKSQQAYDYHAALILGLCEGPIDDIVNIWANGSTTTTTTLSALNMIFAAGTTSEGVWSFLTTNYPSQAIAYRLTALVASQKIDLGESATIPDNDFEVVRVSAASFVVGASPTSTFIAWGTTPANFANYAGCTFKLITGAGVGETETIQSVTSAGVTLASALSTAPTAGDAFTIEFAYTHFQSAGGWINPNSHVQSSCFDCLMSDIITDFLTNPQYGLGWSSADLGSIAQYAAYQRAQGLFFSPLLNSPEKVTSIIDRWAQISNALIYWSGTQLQFVPLADAAITGNGVTFTPQNDVAYDLTLADFLAETGADSGPVKVTRIDPADAYNRTVLNITDRTLGYISNPFEYKAQTLVDTYGQRDNSNVQADEICDPVVARIVVQLLGKRAAYIRNTYEFKTSYRFILCLPGTVLTLTEPNIGLNAVRVRVTKISEDDKGQLSFTCEEFPGTVATYVPPIAAPTINTATTPDQLVAPGNVNTPAVVEPDAAYTGGQPQIVIAASGGASWGGCTVNLSFDGTSYSQVGVISAAATQGLLTGNLAAYGGTNPDTGNTLAVDCTESLAATAPVTNADAVALRTLSLVAAQPTLVGGALVVPADGELLAFGDVTTTGTYTADLTFLERGQYGTAPGAHSTGDQFTLLNVAGTDGTSIAFDLPPQYVGATIYLKLASFNLFGLAQQDLSTCAEYQYTPTGAGFQTVALADVDIPAGAFINVYMTGGATHVTLADDSTGTFANGFALFPIASGAMGVIQTSGTNTAVAVAANAPQVWLSTAGGYVTAAPTTPGAVVQLLGAAVIGQGVIFLPGAVTTLPGALLTEGGDTLITEAGDTLTAES